MLLQHNLEEHLQEMYEWRSLEKLNNKQNEFDLKQVVKDLESLSNEEQVYVVSSLLFPSLLFSP